MRGNHYRYLRDARLHRPLLWLTPNCRDDRMQTAKTIDKGPIATFIETRQMPAPYLCLDILVRLEEAFPRAVNETYRRTPPRVSARIAATLAPNASRPNLAAAYI